MMMLKVGSDKMELNKIQPDFVWQKASMLQSAIDAKSILQYWAEKIVKSEAEESSGER
jgi:hypothetical protein